MTDVSVEDFLEHVGVKGMKWGVRKSDSGGSGKPPSARQVRKDKIVNRELANFSVTTKLGETVDVKQKPVGKLGTYIASLSDMGTKQTLNTSDFDFSVGGRTVGKASMDRISKNEIYLEWLGVSPSERGKGYGSAVFDAAVKHGQETGAKKLKLDVPSSSPDARHIYEKQGFTAKAKQSEVGVIEMELDLTKRSVKHADLDDEDEFENAMVDSFMTLPKELEDDIFGEGDEEVEHSEIDEDVADFLEHVGVKGMKWGVRRDASRPDGVSSKVNRDAKKDAQEFARAKMFYGEGAGTRRKLIKATVEAKSKKDPNYKKAFDSHFAGQDLGKHASKAASERKRKDVTSSTTKTAKGVHRQLTGGFGNVSMVSAALASGVVVARQTGLDKKLMDSAKNAYASANSRPKKQGSNWLKDNGFI